MNSVRCSVASGTVSNVTPREDSSGWRLGSSASSAGMIVEFASHPYPQTLPLRACAAAHGQLPVGQPLAAPHGQLLGGVHGQQFVELPQGQCGLQQPFWPQHSACGTAPHWAIMGPCRSTIGTRCRFMISTACLLCLTTTSSMVLSFSTATILATLARRQQSNRESATVLLGEVTANSNLVSLPAQTTSFCVIFSRLAA